MNKPRPALLLLLASAGLGAAGHPALAAQLVPLGLEEDKGDLVLLSNLGYEALQLRLFDAQGRPQGPPVDVNSEFSDSPFGPSKPWGGDLAWAGNSLIVAWVAAIFPYDQHDVFMRRFVKK